MITCNICGKNEKEIHYATCPERWFIDLKITKSFFDRILICNECISHIIPIYLSKEHDRLERERKYHGIEFNVKDSIDIDEYLESQHQDVMKEIMEEVD